jgi:serine/threonine-protein kinase
LPAVVINDERDVAALARAGRHADAARVAADAGDHAAAARLWETIWDFAAASLAWEAAGDRAAALRTAILARDEARVSELATALAATDDGAAAALEVFAGQRRHHAAGPVAERLGQRERAIEHYLRAHRDLDAARLLEAAGRDREATRVLERALDLAGDEDRAEIHLRLGRILVARGHADAGARHLQEASRGGLPPALELEARRTLIVALAAMGLTDAARDALIVLRRAHPEVPADLGLLLRAARDAAPRRSGDRELVAGRYRLEALLGAGAAGRVFRAVDEVSDRTVALKMFFAASARGGPAFERFARESRLAAALRHPALVEVYDVSLDHGYLVMEYLAGGSLAQRLAGDERPSGAQVRRMALELIGGLELAHHRGVVHRDVKPANVFFDSRGGAKLGDFGVAHLADLGQTQTGGLIGTLAYMAPEQITGAPITVAADQYALGVTLFEALCGRLPFLGPDFVAQHLGEAPPAATSVADVAPAWDPILARMLQKAPTARYPSLAQLRDELEHLDQGDRRGPAMARPRRDSRPYDLVALAAGAAETEAAAETVADADADAADDRRHRFETPLGATAHSRLTRAVDAVLDRSIVLERFEPGAEADAALARALRLARAGSPFVQRVLGHQRATRTVVFEAPAGGRWAEPGRPPPERAEALRLLKRLARALAAIHDTGGAHGAIGPTTVVVDEGAVPTLIAAGLPPPSPASPADDVAAVIALCAAACGLPAAGPEDGARALADLLAGPLPAARAAALAALPRGDGEALYAWADAVELAALRRG